MKEKENENEVQSTTGYLHVIAGVVKTVLQGRIENFNILKI